MKITVELPDDVTRHANAGREALEALAIEGYRSGALSHHQAAQFLELTQSEFDSFLKARNVYDHAYSIGDLERDMEDLRKFEARRAAHRP